MEFLDSVIDFLGERQGILRQYNWQIAFGIVAGILAAIAARERAKNWSKLKDRHRDKMRQEPIRATVVFAEAGREVRYFGSISSCTTGFCVFVEQDGHPVLDEVITSLDETEAFLRQNTKFTLADFQ